VDHFKFLYWCATSLLLDDSDKFSLTKTMAKRITKRLLIENLDRRVLMDGLGIASSWHKRDEQRYLGP
jgi:hypothetical protein